MKRLPTLAVATTMSVAHFRAEKDWHGVGENMAFGHLTGCAWVSPFTHDESDRKVMKRQRLLSWALVLVLAGIGVALSFSWLQPVADRFGAGLMRSSARRSVILLVHGMTWNNKKAVDIWGSRRPAANEAAVEWDGMIGFLQQQGLRFGGVIHANGSKLSLPDCLDKTGTTGDPQTADFFSLEFSYSANADGLAYKSLELAVCLKEVRRFAGAAKVNLVAHSAGGLVCRVVLQSALPGVEYEPHSVDRMVTIGTPHLGAAIARELGDLLGTRATSLKPNAELIRRLNDSELPADVKFAAIVVRGFAADVRGDGRAYDSLIDQTQLNGLPIDYLYGGDQVVHVRSQNLRLSRCAARYEMETGIPVQSILCRVVDPSPNDQSFFESTVHVAATRDRQVQTWVAHLIGESDTLWRGLTGKQLDTWDEYQARLCAISSAESAVLDRHRFSEVTSIKVKSLELTREDGQRRAYRFSAEATSRNVVIRTRVRTSQVTGTLNLAFDEFGRIRHCSTSVANYSE